ncbi:NAD(P)H-dependent glycerol-3-phosphate dehydrogenase [Cocleimonas flava]|uniref:Glycerol-3-phosphate dehydrogenase [NAD(P)+] n=1 Tax=Cocleimonas flava TaxID=634765 RepID=A0A4R1ER77_9GAMM|nr:NAD(P)H-dependent glycerol-3-phosphate dehydrogenase [Cocleimonas flava]TCJ82960.1 glycerol 3-phosphate dehydrogenase (NAD(P)+) [Cocleimonas flava]
MTTSERPQKISVYGAGSWGTALALQLARNGLDVLLWGFDPKHIEACDKARENTAYLPGIPFPDNLRCTDSIDDLVQHSDDQLIVIPSHGFRDLLKQLKPKLNKSHTIVWATKGLEVGSGKLLHEVLIEELGDEIDYGLVSGPTFATEVAKGLPSAMTAAASTVALAERTAAAFQGGNYRVYTSDDVLGVELGGAVKNVLAIAAGISDGLGFGANARAAIITRGLAEIMRLADKMGAQNETIMGLSGVGDLVLTCTDNQSRNRRLGLALGEGKNIDVAIAEIGQAVEGAKTSHSIHLLADRAGVEMPISACVHKVIYENMAPEDAVKELLARELKPEF